MQKFSGEICNECFYIIKPKIDELIETIKQRKNSCEEGVCIYKKSKDTATGNKMPEVPINKLQPKRHKKPLLWLLSHFS